MTNIQNKLTEEMILEIREVTEDTLRLLGLSGAYKGFNYLIYGVELAIADSDSLTSVCKGSNLEAWKGIATGGNIRR